MLTLLGAAAPAAPDAVADAERAAREAADRHLEAASRLAATTAEREALEASIAQTEARLAELEAIARERSAQAYKRAGSTLSVSFDVADAEELDRSQALLARVAADDARTFEELRRTSEELESQRGQLQDRLAKEEAEARRLEETADELNAQLAAARQQAEREAAAAAAAEAAQAERAARDAAASTSAPTTSGSGSGSGSGSRPAPPPPPPDYTGTPGTHPQQNHPWMVCTRRIESGGNYQAHNPAGPFWGAYQFLQSTWNAAANNYGRPDLVGVRPDRASAYDQDDLAWRLFGNGNGAGNWGGRCMSGW